MATATGFNTKEALLDAAAVSVREKGYNALSFRDLAADVGVKSSSVHHYFPTKSDLADALIDRFHEDLLKYMQPLLDKPFEVALDSYVALHRSGFDGSSKICIGAMMSAEITALPASSRGRLEKFIDAHTVFIAVILKKKHKRMTADALAARAFAIFAALEGAQVVTRGLGGDAAVFDRIIETYRASGLLA